MLLIESVQWKPGFHCNFGYDGVEDTDTVTKATGGEMFKGKVARSMGRPEKDIALQGLLKPLLLGPGSGTLG